MADTPPTRRQLDCLVLAAAGLSAREIGRQLGISSRTVEHHLARLCAQLGVRTRVQALAVAVQCGWLPASVVADRAVKPDEPLPAHRRLPRRRGPPSRPR